MFLTYQSRVVYKEFVIVHCEDNLLQTTQRHYLDQADPEYDVVPND
jgi:hypothetical protein